MVDCVSANGGASCYTCTVGSNGKPCQNGGTAKGSTQSNTCGCACKAGFDGDHCQNLMDPCAGKDCGYGDCNNGICVCTAGWNGGDCKNNIDDCTGKACSNQGSCSDGVSTYTCNCIGGFAGNDCQINVDECEETDCGNGSCIDGVNTFSCECAAGWNGADCKNNINECASVDCGNGSCIDGVNSYNCECADGWDGADCQIAQQCTASANGQACANGGSASGTTGNCGCDCAAGWEGANCQSATTTTTPTAAATTIIVTSAAAAAVVATVASEATKIPFQPRNNSTLFGPKVFGTDNGGGGGGGDKSNITVDDGEDNDQGLSSGVVAVVVVVVVVVLVPIMIMIGLVLRTRKKKTVHKEEVHAEGIAVVADAVVAGDNLAAITVQNPMFALCDGASGGGTATGAGDAASCGVTQYSSCDALLSVQHFYDRIVAEESEMPPMLNFDLNHALAETPTVELLVAVNKAAVHCCANSTFSFQNPVAEALAFGQNMLVEERRRRRAQRSSSAYATPGAVFLPEDFTATDAATIHVYTQDTPLYVGLNGALGGWGLGGFASIMYYLHYAKLLITACSKLPSFSGRLYRGVRLPPSVVLGGKGVGDILELHAITSTSMTPDVLRDKTFLGIGDAGMLHNNTQRTVFQYAALSAVKIQQFSALGDEAEQQHGAEHVVNEDEVLFLPGARFRIDSIKTWEFGVVEVQLHQLPPEVPGRASADPLGVYGSICPLYEEINDYLAPAAYSGYSTLPPFVYDKLHGESGMYVFVLCVFCGWEGMCTCRTLSHFCFGCVFFFFWLFLVVFFLLAFLF